MPLARMQRLKRLLAGDDSETTGLPREDARFRAEFGHDAQGIVTIRLRVEASLPLQCQRSLLPYLEPVQRSSLLAVVESLAEEDLLPEDYEPVLVEDGRLALLELVEDELLLAVPQVPRNPALEAVMISTADASDPGGLEAGAPGGDDAEARRRPFADLAELLGRDK